MAQRGRKSADAHEVSAQLATLRMPQPVHRPDAPYDLNDEQSALWQQIVEDLPADHFTGRLQPMLADYCRHTVEASQIAHLIERMKSSGEFDIDEYDKLLRMRERETRAAMGLAIKVGITNSEDRKAQRRKSQKTIESVPWQK